MIVGDGQLEWRNHYLVCAGTPPDVHGERLKWCGHLKDFLHTGEDAPFVTADSRIEVPVFPTSDIFASVHIKPAEYPNGGAPMELNYIPDVGRPYTLSLGIWNPGEGLGSIRRVIVDYMRSQMDPEETAVEDAPIRTKCPSTRTHAVSYTRLMRKPESLDWKVQCLWNIVFEKMCSFCLEAASDPLSDGSRGVSAGGNSGSFSGRFGNS